MKTILEYFHEDIRLWPDAMAVADRQGDWSYAELGRLSHAVASVLIRCLDGRMAEGPLKAWNTRCVGVILPRKKEALAAFLGIMESGNVYVFMPPDTPEERLRYILRDAAMEYVITDRENAGRLRETEGIQTILMEELEEARGKESFSFLPLPRAQGDGPAFITYTSGSTGKPKGAIDTYSYIENHVSTRLHYYTPGADEAVGCVVSFSYAASTYDLFSGIRAGFGLYIFHEEEMLDARVMAERIIRYRVTSVFMIPGMIPVMYGSGKDLPVRCIITAGEKMKKVPSVPAKIVEIYGSSEAAAVIGRVAGVSDPWDLLGKPVPGVTLFLLDRDGSRITEAGVEGELAVVSDALTLGYMNMADMNREKLTDCPFLPGKKMYLSGDLMRMDGAGSYYFCGRKDNMVKLNGQRAELGEIEYAVAGYPGVRDAVCRVFSRNGTDMLACYYTLQEGETVDGKALASWLTGKIPAFMVPGYFIAMDRFPVNMNGKTDRSRLPEPAFGALCENTPPRDYLEKKLLAIARELLPDIEFGVTDDIRRLGLDSVKAVRFVAGAQAFDPRLTVSSVLRFGKIRDVMNAPKENVWFFENYDARKPVLVLIHGIVPVSGYAMLCEDWSRYFNLLIIGPFPDHIEEEPGVYDYEQLVSYYDRKVRETVPEDASLWGFAGFSFGGQLAVSLADAWRKEKGEYPYALMGDTLIQHMVPGKVLPPLNAEDPLIRAISRRGERYGDSAVNEPLEAILDKQNKTVRLLNTVKTNLKYEGPVIYLDAQQDYEPLMEKAKVAIVRSFYRNIRVFEFRDYYHNDLYLSREMLTFYKNLFLMTMKRA